MNCGTYDLTQPWVIYRFRSGDMRTRITGRSRVLCECAICGETVMVVRRIARFGVVNPEGTTPPERTAFLKAHAHPGMTRNPMSWAKPLLNPAVYE